MSLLIALVVVGFWIGLALFAVQLVFVFGAGLLVILVAGITYLVNKLKGV